MPYQTNEDRYEEYVSKTVARINAKYHCNVVHVHDIQEMEQYIAEHQTEQKIGFLLKAPDYMNQPYHYSPIYFERRGATETFAQFDSMQGIPYLVPQSGNPLIERAQYYSPFQRQVSGEGCLEDAVKILTKSFKDEELIDFCVSNSVVNTKITESMTDTEAAQYASARDVKYMSAQQKETMLSLGPQISYQCGKESLLKHGQQPIENLRKLTSLPARFLVNIEHYGTMRHFMETEPEKFKVLYKENETVLQHIQRKGRMRIEDIKTTIVDPKNANDFKGQDFLARQKRYHEKATNPAATKASVTVAILAKERFKTTYTHTISELRALISSGANLADLNDRSGYTPLHALSLCSEVTPEDLEDILGRSNGLNIDEQGSYGYTALQLAVENREIPYVQVLLNKSPEIGVRNNFKTVLMSAMLNIQPIEMMKLLLVHYPDHPLIEIRNSEHGWTPLMLAIADIHNPKHVEIVKFLLNAGADPTAKASSAFPVTYNGIQHESNASVLDIAESIDQAAKPGDTLFAPIIKRAMGLEVAVNTPQIDVLPPYPEPLMNNQPKKEGLGSRLYKSLVSIFGSNIAKFGNAGSIAGAGDASTALILKQLDRLPSDPNNLSTGVPNKEAKSKKANSNNPPTVVVSSAAIIDLPIQNSGNSLNKPQPQGSNRGP